MNELNTTKPQGWIKIHRDLANHWCASDPNFLAVWFRLLSEANFKTKKSLINSATVEIKRGQLIFGLNAFSSRSGVSVSKLRRIMKVLEDENMIDRQKTNKFSIISIVSYNKYQDEDRQNAVKQHSNDIQNTTPKEVNNSKKDKKSIIKRKSSYPNDFIPSKDNAETYWKQKSRTDLSYAEQVVKFMSHCKANGKTFVCWQSAWTTWYGNAVDFNKPTQSGNLSTFEMAKKRMEANR